MIRLEKIKKEFNGKRIIPELTIAFSEKEINTIYAPSGAGKTTLMRIIAGLDKHFSGKRIISTSKIAYLFQEDRLFPWYTARQNIEVITNRKEDYENWIEILELGEHLDKYPNELSGGMKRKLMLAITFLSDFDIMILDEPFKGIDHKSKEKIIYYIKENAKEKTILLISHEMEEIKMMGGLVWKFNERMERQQE